MLRQPTAKLEWSALRVMKFGGSVLKDRGALSAVATHIIAMRDGGQFPVVVVSALAGETDRLLALSRHVGAADGSREQDAILATGEHQAAALLAVALQSCGSPAQSFTAAQLPIVTDACYGNAAVRFVAVEALLAAVSKGIIPVVAGFQGVTDDGSLTTLGRGGSDTTAVAIAAALGGVPCELIKDVAGVFATDPRRDAQALPLARLTFNQMIELAAHGAKVLQLKSVELAAAHGVSLLVRDLADSSFGTWIVPNHEAMTLNTQLEHGWQS